MSIIKPFKAVRPDVTTVEAIAALPYDVYSSQEARAFVADRPLSFLKIDRAETFFDPSVDIHSPKVYQKAHDALYEMIEKGALVQESKAVLYLYQLTMDGREQTGLVTCTSVDAYIKGSIKKHENTRADKELDRINHVDYCDANTGPIFLTYKSKVTITNLSEDWKKGHDPLFDFIAEDGVGHKVWLIDEPTMITSLVEAFARVEALYIADGHHRAASAVKVAQMRRETNPEYTGEEPYNYFLSVLFPDDQLSILDYNRVVKDLNGLSQDQFLEALSHKFDIVEKSDQAIRPKDKGTFGMYLNKQWYKLLAKEGSYDNEDPVKKLDVAILQDNLLTPILGIGDLRVDNRIDFVGGIRGLKELERRVALDMEVAFSMYPTSITELIDIADAGELMPPKSTWFEPKLRSGVFIHLLK